MIPTGIQFAVACQSVAIILLVVAHYRQYRYRKRLEQVIERMAAGTHKPPAPTAPVGKFDHVYFEENFTEQFCPPYQSRNP